MSHPFVIMLAMGRGQRIDPVDGWHHVMNRGVDRQTVFHTDADRVEFGRLLGEIHERRGVEVHAYCLMPNHYHLVLHCPDGCLSASMQHLGSTFTRHVNERLGRDGPLFRGRFRSIPITDDAYLLAAVRYIHRNPLGIAGVDEVSAYRWSSHRTYLGRRRCPDYVRTDVVLGHFADDVDRFRRFVECDEYRRPAGRSVSVGAITAAVASMIDAHVEDGAGPGVARTVLVLLLERLPDPLACRLRSELAFENPAAEHAAIRRARRRVADEPLLGEIAVAATRFLGLRTSRV